MSRRRQRAPLSRYCDWPSRVTMRLTEISLNLAYSPTMVPSELSNTSSTEAWPTGLRALEPEKITSVSESPRRRLAALSPMTQRIASMMLDLPQPFGPTMPVMLVGRCNVVGSTKDLNPASFIVVRRMELPLRRARSIAARPGRGTPGRTSGDGLFAGFPIERRTHGLRMASANQSFTRAARGRSRPGARLAGRFPTPAAPERRFGSTRPYAGVDSSPDFKQTFDTVATTLLLCAPPSAPRGRARCRRIAHQQLRLDPVAARTRP